MEAYVAYYSIKGIWERKKNSKKLYHEQITTTKTKTIELFIESMFEWNTAMHASCSVKSPFETWNSWFKYYYYYY